MAYAVREGDPTSTGGFVVSGSATQLGEERRLARMGDPVWCPACEKVGYIVQGNPTFIDEYIAVATQGHKVQCGCERGTRLPSSVYCRSAKISSTTCSPASCPAATSADSAGAAGHNHCVEHGEIVTRESSRGSTTRRSGIIRDL